MSANFNGFPIGSISLASLYSVERKIVGSRNFHLALSKEQVQHEDTIGSFIRPASAIVVDRLRLTQLRLDGRFSRSDDRHPALDQTNVPERNSRWNGRARATADDLLVGEIRCFDDQRVSLEPAAGIPVPLA